MYGPTCCQENNVLSLLRIELTKGMAEEKQKVILGSDGIRTHASEETGALNQRLRPLGHATLLENGRS